MNDERTCAVCGEGLQASWKVCPSCTTPVPDPNTCPSCGEATKPHWKLCPACGNGLGASLTPAPSTPIPPSPSSPFVSLAATPPVASPGFSPTTPTSPAAASLPQLEPGVRLGKYEVRRRLGAGGSGSVYEAVDTVLGKPVAVKVVAGFGDAGATVRSLADEYLAQERVTDRRHVVAVHPPDRVAHANLEWVLLPMELASGSLADWLRSTDGDRKGRLERGLELLRQACAGVEALHGAGMLHLDVKPANLLLVGAGDEAVVKVADFGLARGLGRLAAERPELQVDGVGTPAYMAPEQVLAAHWKDVGEAADVYGLGMVLYELLDGDLPYSGTAEQVRAKKRDPAVRIRRPEGLAHLVELAMRCLEGDPARRPTVAEVRAGLVAVTPVELAAVERARKAGSEAEWQCYLEAYPEGVFAGEARSRLGELVAEREAEEKAASEKRAREAKAKERREAEARRKREAEERRRREEEERRRREGVPPSDPSPLDVWLCEKEGLEYVFIPPGQFEMGASPGDEKAEDCEKPRHPVRVKRGFWMGRTPVTVAAYRRYCDAKGLLMRKAPDCNPSWMHGKHPMVWVSWEDALAYCEWAGARLPSEAEWEYAARSGTGWPYWWGDEFDETMIWGSLASTHPVGQKPESPWKLYDMLGTVQEWCADPWHDDYKGSPSEAVVWAGDVKAGYLSTRVLRGGSCFRKYPPEHLRVSARMWGINGHGHEGFRCVRDVSLFSSLFARRS